MSADFENTPPGKRILTPRQHAQGFDVLMPDGRIFHGEYMAGEELPDGNRIVSDPSVFVTGNAYDPRGLGRPIVFPGAIERTPWCDPQENLTNRLHRKIEEPA